MRKITVRIKQRPKKEVFIDTGFIRLDAALKLADLVQSGGHAKVAIQGGEVRVNGEICTERGRKLHGGDVATFDGTDCVIVQR